jgi:hypothetical protein
MESTLYRRGNNDEEDNVRLWNDEDAAKILVADKTCATIEEAKRRVNDVVEQMEILLESYFRPTRVSLEFSHPLKAASNTSAWTSW